MTAGGESSSQSSSKPAPPLFSESVILAGVNSLIPSRHDESSFTPSSRIRHIQEANGRSARSAIIAGMPRLRKKAFWRTPRRYSASLIA